MQQPTAQNMYVSSTGAPLPPQQVQGSNNNANSNSNLRVQQTQQQQLTQLYHQQQVQSQQQTTNASRGGNAVGANGGRHQQQQQQQLHQQQLAAYPQAAHPQHQPSHQQHQHQQSAMHPGMVMPAFTQFTPRQTPYQAAVAAVAAQGGYSFATPLQPNYYNYFFSTLQQAPQVPHATHAGGPPQQQHAGHVTTTQHSRGVQNVVNNVNINGSNPTTTNVANAALQLAAVGGVPPIGVATGTNQVNVAPLVGQLGVLSVVPPQPATSIQPLPTHQRRQRRHALKIIDPTTNKNILEDLNLNKNSNSHSVVSEYESLASTATTSNPIDYNESTSASLANGGSVLIDANVSSHTTQPIHTDDVGTMPQHMTTNPQTPVVSALSAAHTVEILPTPQKPRPKKILTIVAPKDEPNEKPSTYVKETTTTNTTTTANINNNNPISNQQQTQELQEPQETNEIWSKQQSPPQLLESENTIENDSSKTTDTDGSIEKNSIISTPTGTEDVNVVASAPSYLPSSIEINKETLLEHENKGNEEEISNNMSTTTIINEPYVEEHPEQQLEVIKNLNETQTNVDENVKNVNESITNNTINDTSTNNQAEIELEKKSTDKEEEETNKKSMTTTSSTTSTDETDRALKQQREQRELQQQLEEIDCEKIEKLENPTTISSTPIVTSLITYNSGQWSPQNQMGKKQYDREQLLRLRDAKASRILPQNVNLNEHIICPAGRSGGSGMSGIGGSGGNNNNNNNLMMPPFAQRNQQQQQQQGNGNNHKRVQSMLGIITCIGGSNQQQNSSYMNKSSICGRSSMKRDVIHVNLSLNQDVKLNETDNAWRPRLLPNTNSSNNNNNKSSIDNSNTNSSNKEQEVNAEAEKIELIRRVRGILNKLTPEKFDALSAEIMALKIDSPDKMQAVIELVFEKAIDEPNFSVSYARLCFRLISEAFRRDKIDDTHDKGRDGVAVEMEEETKSNLLQFRSSLIDKTEREFTHNVVQSAMKEQKLQPIAAKIKKSDNPAEKAELQALLEEEERKIRRRSGGTVRFIGELFKTNMLTPNIINSCINTLLNQITEDRLECLCKLLTTVGAKFESTPRDPKDPKSLLYNLDRQIARMQAIASKSDKDGSKISSRVRFMLQDVIDLRKTKWQSKKQEVPKTMQQIEKETKNEQMSAQYLNYSANSSINSNMNKRSLDIDNRGRGFDSNRMNYGGSHSQRASMTGSSGAGDTNSLRRTFHSSQSGAGGMTDDKDGDRSRQRGGDRDVNNSTSSHLNTNNNNNNSILNNNNNSSNSNNNSDDTWHVQTKSGRSLTVDTNKLGLLNKGFDIANKKMGGAAIFQWNTKQQSSSSTTTVQPTNPFAPLSTLSDTGTKFNDRERDRIERNSGRNKGSFNKGSMERERYAMNSRSGSTQASRENSITRGGNSGSQNGRNAGVGNNSSLVNNMVTTTANSTKSSALASHNKYAQQNLSSGNNRIPSKNLITSSGLGGNSSSYFERENLNQAISNTSELQATAPSEVIFVEPTDEDKKLIKQVVSELEENASNAKKLNDNVVSCLKRIPNSLRVGFLYYILTDYLHLKEVNHMSRRFLSLSILYAIQRNVFITIEHLRLAYDYYCEQVSELIVDIPELWLYIFEFIGPFLIKNMFNINDLWCKKLRDEASPSMSKKFLKTFLSYSTREIGPGFTKRMWSKMKIKWTDYMPESDVQQFVQSNKFGFLENDNIQPSTEKNVNDRHFKERIDILMKIEDASADDIIDYINGNVSETDKPFIRRLTTILCENCILDEEKSIKLDTEKFRKLCIPILTRFIDSVPERELEVLYTMQIIVHNFEHPRGLLNELFGELFDADVIPQDSFLKWRDSKDQSAGKGVAVKALNPFFRNMLSGETSDDNEN